MRVQLNVLLGAALFSLGLGSAVIAADLPPSPYEKVPAGEKQATDEIVATIQQQVKSAFDANGFATRDAHAKAHGCVKAVVTVRDDLPDYLQTSVFQSGAEYPAWIRYSNGSGESQDDEKGDGRGMAVKLMNVQGEKLLAGQENEQTLDFLMINHPVFFVRNAADYVEFSKAVAQGSPLPFFFPGVNPLKWRLHEVGIARKIQSKEVSNPLAVRYWSMTPSQWGPYAAKISARPCSALAAKDEFAGDPDKLRRAMAKSLSNGDACFLLQTQLKNSNVGMPIEDPTIEWSERSAPFTTVATISIPRQEFTSREQLDFCENLSMTPWHATADHRPLGGINRVRRVVYQAISDLRHELNGVTPREPAADWSF